MDDFWGTTIFGNTHLEPKKAGLLIVRTCSWRILLRTMRELRARSDATGPPEKVGTFAWKCLKSFPIGSMYGIFTDIWHRFMVNVGKYTIHGSHGFGVVLIIIFWDEFLTFSGRWFHIYIFFQHPGYLGEWSNLTTTGNWYFSTGLKPPPSSRCSLMEGDLKIKGNVRCWRCWRCWQYFFELSKGRSDKFWVLSSCQPWAQAKLWPYHSKETKGCDVCSGGWSSKVTRKLRWSPVAVGCWCCIHFFVVVLDTFQETGMKQYDLIYTKWHNLDRGVNFFGTFEYSLIILKTHTHTHCPVYVGSAVVLLGGKLNRGVCRTVWREPDFSKKPVWHSRFGSSSLMGWWFDGFLVFFLGWPSWKMVQHDVFFVHTYQKSSKIYKKTCIKSGSSWICLIDFCLGFGPFCGFVQNQIQAMVPG